MFSVRDLFTAAALIQYLKVLPIIKTPVMDTVFKNKPQLGLPIVGRDEINTVVQAMPLTRRGAPSIPIAASSASDTFYEPFPINPSVFIGAHDLNNLKLIGQTGRQMWAQTKTDTLRRTIRKTCEAMCAVSLTGTLSWPVQLEGGSYDNYVVNFGAPLAYVPDTLWDATGAKLKVIFECLSDMAELLEDNGYGSEIEFWAGKTAFGTLLSIAEAVTTTAKIRVEISEEGINIGGYLIKRRTEKYRNPQTGAMTPTVADDDLLGIALDAGHVMPYCALDDLDANLQPLPMFVKPLERKDPSGVKLIGNSKPFPSPNMKGIVKATVTGT